MNNQTLELEYNYSPLLPNNKNARILDAGCGHGRILNFLYEKAYQNLLGVDRDKEALEKISPKLKEKVVYATA